MFWGPFSILLVALNVSLRSRVILHPCKGLPLDLQVFVHVLHAASPGVNRHQ